MNQFSFLQAKKQDIQGIFLTLCVSGWTFTDCELKPDYLGWMVHEPILKNILNGYVFNSYYVPGTLLALD